MHGRTDPEQADDLPEAEGEVEVKSGYNCTIFCIGLPKGELGEVCARVTLWLSC